MTEASASFGPPVIVYTGIYRPDQYDRLTRVRAEGTVGLADGGFLSVWEEESEVLRDDVFVPAAAVWAQEIR